MAALPVEQPTRPHVRALRDSRPPSHTWSTTTVSSPDQPPLGFTSFADSQAGPAQPVGHLVHAVGRPWGQTAAPELPNVRAWSGSLALAVAETLQGRRPVGQLSRWVSEQGLATINRGLRRHLAGHGPSVPVRPAVLRSVHLQFPQPHAVEVSAHVQISGRSSALAFRLEVWHDRWLCTALEMEPTPRG
jgi:hypothetical protein